ncbi:hypothetical protein SAMN05444008_11286 [Cnuella takakiae]|uniref:Uncharacterized protein n=1 Tax=Cnuella takakiae TaxID=1302690 RepID=A0A1M5EKR3_9BACT|nr:hypothetical protein [Cnuella takakiae]SHF79805.1 hypothetical protein SAMN05444008_11286 [Cnuella takakiae]
MKKNLLQRYVEQVEREQERRRQEALPLRQKLRNLKLHIQQTLAPIPTKKAIAAPKQPSVGKTPQQAKPVQMISQNRPMPSPGGRITNEEARRQIIEVLKEYDRNKNRK